MKKTTIKVKLHKKNKFDRLTYGEIYSEIGYKLRTRYPGLKTNLRDAAPIPKEARNCRFIRFQIAQEYLACWYEIFSPVVLSKCGAVGWK